MKMICPWASRRKLLAIAVLISLGSAVALAQVSSIVPVVTVQATQPSASPANPGVFTVFRAGSTDATLNVWYDLGGTASNGVDYKLIPPHLVQIAAGAISNSIMIFPITGTPSSTVKTVVLDLTNSPLLNPVNYEISSPSRTVVFLESGSASNLPPSVGIIAPNDGAVFYTPITIQILAQAADPGGSVTNVEFFAGTNDLGQGNPVVLDPPGVNGFTGLVYSFNWLNPSTGQYPLTAVAAADNRLSATSAPVNITVLQGPPTNPPPVVRIVSPANGSVFRAPINLPLIAFASELGGTVASVEFFANDNDLGSGHPVTAVSPPTPPGPIQPPILIVVPTNYSELVWTNPAPAANVVLTARATDVAGISRTSAPVNISVLPPLPPPTNRPPPVNIVATDPVAIEGTNCWIWPGETNAPPTWSAWPKAVCCFFTNCGPKTATFTVHRFGDTNGDLAVPYNLGGTASNGVDYVMLPGLVTVPSGERAALISIVPIDDGPSDVNKTVILSLVSSTNTPPDYRLGFPPSAGAIILDGQWPRPAANVLAGGCFHLTTPGPDAAWFCIEYSTDLVNWMPICTNQVVNGSIDYVDPDAPGNPSRFYRVVPLSGPPAE